MCGNLVNDMLNRTHIKIDTKIALLILESFKVADHNSDGFINPEQFKLLWRSLGQVISDKKLETLTQESFNKLENGQDMDLPTFLDIFSIKYVYPPSNKSIHDALNLLGLNTSNDLRKILSKGDDKLTDEQIDRFMEIANLTNNYSDLLDLFTNKIRNKSMDKSGYMNIYRATNN